MEAERQDDDLVTYIHIQYNTHTNNTSHATLNK